MKRFAQWWCFLGIIPALLFGGHPLVTDDTGTQGKGPLQLEWTPEFYRLSREMEVAFPLVITYGVHERKDLIFSLPYCIRGVRFESWLLDRQLEPQTLELKWRVMDNQHYSVAWKTGMGADLFPEFQSNGMALFNTLIQTISWREVLVHCNQGVVFAKESGRWWMDWHISTALEILLSEKVHYIANLVLERDSDLDSHQYPFYSVIGFQYAFSPAVIVDLGYRQGLNAVDRFVTVLMGITLIR